MPDPRETGDADGLAPRRAPAYHHHPWPWSTTAFDSLPPQWEPWERPRSAPGRARADRTPVHERPLSTAASDSNPPRARRRLRSPVPADPLAPGRGPTADPPLHEFPLSPTASDSDAPPGWDWLPGSPLSADSLVPGRAAAAADHSPSHECRWWPTASHSNAPPGGDSSSAWDQGEWRPRSPTDALVPEYFDQLAGYFVEAAGRLPLAEIPFLARCVKLSALAIGFADPVTNILLSTIDAFVRTDPYMMRLADHTAIEETRNKASFAGSARSSYVALNRFMLCYFRYLTEAQADLFLHMAAYDLRVAIEAVQSYVGGSLLPDSARTKSAFEEAAYPRCYAPDLLRLMTSSYSCAMVDPVLEDLRQGGKLTPSCVYKLCKLLRHPLSPPLSRAPSPTPGISRDSNGGVTNILCFGDGSFATTHISKDGVATATFTTSGPAYAGFSEGATNLLSMFPIHHGRLALSHKELCSVTLETPEFLPFLRFQLLDMVHKVYLKAIAMLPVRALREDHLLHSLVTAGHCYGPLDPVSNIVINTIWYHALFPLSNDVASKLAAADILNARAMHRIESRSINGLVAYLCRSPSMDEQAAVTLLCKHRLDIPILDLYNMCDVAQVAKHPQPAAFAEFLKCSESIRELYKQYCHDRVHGNPDSAIEGIKIALLQSTCVATVQRCAQDMSRSAPIQETALEILSAKRSSFIFQQAQIRRVLEALLIGYGYNDPLAPLYKLGVICGVTGQRNYNYTDVRHANFLASSDGGSSWKLFFAEFWNQPHKRIEESENPFCCPIPDDQEYPGRCVVCENDSSIIVHPQSRKYYMGNSALPFPLPVHLGADTELDFDIIYSKSVRGGGVCGYNKRGGGNDSVFRVLQPVE